MLARIRENQLYVFVFGILTGIFGLSLWQSFVLNSGYSADWMSGFWQNFSTEIMGAIITFALFEIVIGGQRERQAKAEAEQKEKQARAEVEGKERQVKTRELKDLIVRMRSNDNLTAITATEQLRARGWLTDGSLHKAELMEANLQKARLVGANLEQTILVAANLQEARLTTAFLQKSDLSIADLKYASLRFARLENANLSEANLKEVDCEHAHMQQADLRGANLHKAKLNEANFEQANFAAANLREAEIGSVNLRRTNLWNVNLRDAKYVEVAHFDEQTILPDAKYVGKNEGGNIIFDKYWTTDTDMTRYTNPEHPDFWEPNWIKEQRERESNNK